MMFEVVKIPSVALPKPYGRCGFRDVDEHQCREKATHWVGRGMSMTPDEAFLLGFSTVPVEYYYDLYCDEHNRERLV
jgi:hypothetical protein